MNSVTLISLIRHGQVDNPKQVYYGRLPRFRLSENGILQSQAVSRFLRNKKVGAIFSSPLLRARQTALIIRAQHNDLTLRVSKLLNEVDTPFAGHSISELDARGWNVYADVPPEYEQPTDVLRRAKKFMSMVLRQYSGKHVIAVTHGDLIAFSILWAKAVPINHKYAQDLRFLGLTEEYPAPASISTFSFHTGIADELPDVNYVNPSW